MLRLTKLLKPHAMSVALLAVFAAAMGEARADELTFAGNTNGCFNFVSPSILPSTNGAPQTIRTSD